MIGVLIWLVDGTRLELAPRRSEWELVPDDGIAHGLVCLSDDTFRNMSGTDYYFCATAPDGNLLWGHSNDSEDVIRRRYPDAVVKRGKWTSEELLTEIAAEVNAITTGLRHEAPCEGC